MGCLYQIILLPFQVMLIVWNFTLITIKVLFELIIKFYLYCIKSIPELIKGISSLSSKKKNNYNYNKNTTNRVVSTNNKKTNIKESQFDKEAKLWGLTEEDKRIAKEERLSPSDYIEAEERDNDELIDDD